MPDDSYQIIFSGDIIEGRERSDVKRKLQSILKLDGKGIERLFTGKPVVIRKNVPRETAEKFAGAFEKAGAVCRTEPPLAEPPGVKSAEASLPSTEPPGAKGAAPPPLDAGVGGEPRRPRQGERPR